MVDQPSPAELRAILESILFVADEPLDTGAIARSLGVGLAAIEEAVAALSVDCRQRGVRLQQTGSAVQMVTAPETAPYVERFLGLDEDHRLSHAALETLAIIAYKQPITRPAIEAIRGVNCERAVASLCARGLITEVGRAHSAGRPYLFGTTFRFLEHFGLEKPDDLPPLPPLMIDQPLGEDGHQPDTDMRATEAAFLEEVLPEADAPNR
jgi:segregation and condensation protein B